MPLVRVPKVFFCPVCDRPFSSIRSNIIGRRKMIDHLKIAHNEYYMTKWKD
jgi:hypothetical protein